MTDTATAILVMHENMIAAANFSQLRGAETALVALSTGHMFRAKETEEAE